VIHRYHDATKHAFDRFARSLGYLDWASQPDPFRSFDGAPQHGLYPAPGAPQSALGDVLRHSLGLSAWKEFRGSRWSLRVNPSSGNLHPTEAYVVCDAMPCVPAAGVYHYAADRHALEQRCRLDAQLWTRAAGADRTPWLVVLTSIHWREAWKYGERAFRYCQHDLGHAVAAIAIAAELGGRRTTMLSDWSHDEIAALVGLDREADYGEAEREEPGCILLIEPDDAESDGRALMAGRAELVDAVRAGTWIGRAKRLSETQVQWPIIDDIARASRDPGRAPSIGRIHTSNSPNPPIQLPDHPIIRLPDRSVLLQRRSAVAFDGHSSTDAERFLAMVVSAMPGSGAPWDALWWDPRVHLALFVHRVDGIEPGLYMLVRNPRAKEVLQATMCRDFAWEPAAPGLPLFQLACGDCRRLAERVSCDQEIAADGFFTLGMIAEFDASLQQLGPSFYRHLFWETGVVGQRLYLAAEAAGARATGIGCFYDEPVHQVLGLTGHAFQSLYHFTIGIPVEDTRLTTEPGYRWENTKDTKGIKDTKATKDTHSA
jgi:SagB-type dehydrogenase family enzyme